MNTNEELLPLCVDDLATVTGGFLRGGKATGTGPSHPMELLDKPQKTLGIAKDMLGIPDSGRPGDRYVPATASPDGSINQGRFEAPPNPGGVSVPISQ